MACHTRECGRLLFVYAGGMSYLYAHYDARDITYFISGIPDALRLWWRG